MKTILCFGDSNTHGTCALAFEGDNRRFARDVRWPGVMQKMLGADWHVIEEGHPGRTTSRNDDVEGPHKNGLTVLPSLLESHQPLDLVILMLGTNDLKRRFAPCADDISRSLSRLVRMIKTSEAGPNQKAPDLIIVSPVPIRETGWLGPIFEGGATISMELAARYEALAALHDAGFVDAGGIAMVDPVDGIHLEAEAHLHLGQVLARTVMKRFNETGRPDIAEKH